MEKINRKDVVLANVFFSDSTESKVRPCIVLSNEKYNSGGYVIVAQITTAGDEYCIPISEKEVNCELMNGSGARFDMLVKVPQSNVTQRIGRASSEFCSRLAEGICGMIR